jgi:HSP20 family protein
MGMALPSVFDEINRLFDELIHERWGGSRQLVPASLREVEHGWVIELPVEGLRVQDLRLEVQGQRLTVSSHRRHEEEKEHPRAGWSRIEQQTTLRRTIMLPAAGDPNDVEARIEGGVLFITINRRKR